MANLACFGGHQSNGRFLYSIRFYPGRRTPVLPSVKKLSQEIKVKLRSLATGFFMTGNAAGDKCLRRIRAIYRWRQQASTRSRFRAGPRNVAQAPPVGEMRFGRDTEFSARHGKSTAQRLVSTVENHQVTAVAQSEQPVADLLRELVARRDRGQPSAPSSSAILLHTLAM